MDFKKYFKVLPAVAAMFFAVSCSNDKEIVSEPQGLVIPFEATVSSSMQTRAQMNAGYTEYQFQAGDKLWVFGNNITGELTLKAEDAGKTSGTFTGSLDYTGEGSPASDLNLYAVLKGANDELLPATLLEFMAAAVSDVTAAVHYDDNATATDPLEAVKKYSLFVTLNPTTFGNKTFSLYQMSSFLVFDVAFEDGTAAGEELIAAVDNNGADYREREVTTISEAGAIKAKFTAAFLGKRDGLPGLLAPLSDYYTILDGATVSFDFETPISFGGSDFPLVANKFYRVNKCVYASSATYSITADATVLGTPYHSDLVSGKELPYNTDLKAVMTAMGIPDMAQSYVTNCVLKSGNSISMGAFDALNHNCTLSALRSGYSEATMTVMGSSVDLKITVTKE